MEQSHVLIVGVGEVGSALGEVLERNLCVSRVDLEPVAITDPVDVMHLCFPYHTRDQFVEAAVDYIEQFKPALTIVNSTVVPGTVRAIAERTGSRIAYSPIRGKHARMVQELLHYTKFVAALDPTVAEAAEQHFRAVGMRTRRMSHLESLEMAKLGETSYFGVLVAFAQEFNRLTAAVGGDYDEAITFFDEIDFLPMVRYYPGFIGGHCVIPNIHLLRKIASSPLLEAVLESNRRRAVELRTEDTAAPVGSIVESRGQAGETATGVTVSK